MQAYPLTPARRTKIVCTLGPASSDPETIRRLIEHGMNVARINMSHGTREGHRATAERVRSAAEQTGTVVAIMADLQGPKIRTGPLQNGPVELRTGGRFSLTTERVPGGPAAVSVDFEGLTREVAAGDPILLSDGLIELEVEAVSRAEVQTRVVHGGVLGERQGVNIPGGATDLPSLTQKDIADLQFALELGVDYVAQSFVRRAEDVREAKRQIAKAGADTPLIAKIEKPQALNNIEQILAEADGVMVARGDLGVELPPEEVPLWQKRIIARAAYYLVPVITATQMLESMVHQTRPTRAEASDVANAIWDGTDAVMLSAETAIGDHPVEATAMMDRIVRSAETAARPPVDDVHPADRLDFSHDIARAAGQIAETNPDVKLIAAFTKSGYTARLISKERPPAAILALTPSPQVMRRAALFWGVTPLQCQMLGTVAEMVREVDEAARSRYSLPDGSAAIIIGSLPVELSGTTNFLKLHRIGELG